jgi:hypothetical protein
MKMIGAIRDLLPERTIFAVSSPSRPAIDYIEQKQREILFRSASFPDVAIRRCPRGARTASIDSRLAVRSSTTTIGARPPPTTTSKLDSVVVAEEDILLGQQRRQQVLVAAITLLWIRAGTAE